MLRLLWDAFLDLDPVLAAAIIAAAVSVLTSIVAVLFTPMGSYLVSKRQLRDRLKTEYEYEQRKKLRDLIGQYLGRLLQAAEDMNDRMKNLYTHREEESRLQVGDDYRKVGSNPDNYFFQSTVYRFLALFAVRRQFETEAIYVDSRIAEETDFAFIKYMRAIEWIITFPGLFRELPYDEDKPTDHFFRDDLRRVCDSCWVQSEGGEDRIISFDELRDRMGREERLVSTLDFFNGLRADESRYRWDRLVALHLILVAFMNDFGHPFQRSTDADMSHIVAEFKTYKVPRNLLQGLPTLGLEKVESMVRARKALETIAGE
jgi:hypothetical protein